MKQESAGPATLVALAQASVANARDYLDEAQWLLRRQRWGRAQTFAILGREELGKASAYIMSIVTPRALGDQVLVGIREHKVKLAIEEMSRVISAYMLGDHQIPELTLMDGFAAISGITVADNDAKKQGMYVDYRDGAIHRPTDGTPREAKKAVAKLRSAIESSPQLTDAGYHQFLLQLDHATAMVDALWTRLAEAAGSDEEDALPRALAAVMAAVRTGSPLPEIANNRSEPEQT